MQSVGKIVYSLSIVGSLFLSFGFDGGALSVPSVEESVDENVSDYSNLPEVYKASENYSAVTVPDVPEAIRLPKKVPAPPVPVGVPKIESQLKDIIAINDSLKSSYAGQASELHRIQKQSQIHKQILQELTRARGRKPVQRPRDTQELIRQEKIKLIGEEAKKNYDYLQSLKQQDL